MYHHLLRNIFLMREILIARQILTTKQTTNITWYLYIAYPPMYGHHQLQYYTFHSDWLKAIRCFFVSYRVAPYSNGTIRSFSLKKQKLTANLIKNNATVWQHGYYTSLEEKVTPACIYFLLEEYSCIFWTLEPLKKTWVESQV